MNSQLEPRDLAVFVISNERWGPQRFIKHQFAAELPRQQATVLFCDPVGPWRPSNLWRRRLQRTPVPAGGLAPGNKYFKLMGNLAQARRLGVGRLLSFGGAWSNHLHALAAVGAEQGFATVGIIRGDEDGAAGAGDAVPSDLGAVVRAGRVTVVGRIGGAGHRADLSSVGTVQIGDVDAPR